MRCRRIAVAAWTVTAVVLSGGPAARAATNLIADPGFETTGGQATVFADSLPDMDAWTLVSGSFTASAGVITPAGAHGTDLAVVTASADYADGTLQVLATPATGGPGPYGGLVFRYQSSGGHYACAVSRTAVTLLRVTSSSSTTLASSPAALQNKSPVWLQAVASGLNLTCRVLADTGGAPGAVLASAAATDATYANGQIGVFDTNPTTGGNQFLRFSSPQMVASVPAAWSGIQAATGRPGEVLDTVAAADTGTESMQVFGGAAGFDGYSQQTGIAAYGSTVYTLQTAIRTTSVTGGTARVEVVEAPGGTVTTLGNVSGTTAWTLSTTTFTTQPGTTSLTVRTRLTGSGTANFDDLSLTAAPFVSLALSSASLNLGSVSPVGSPFTFPGAVTATVTSDAGWTLQAAGGGDFADGLGDTMPLSALSWARAGSGSYTPFTTSPAVIAAGSATPVAGVAAGLDYRLAVSYADTSSARPYATTITYIATTP